MTTAVNYATLTWATQPQAHVPSQAVVPCIGGLAGHPNTARASVTTILQHWADYPAQNYGFMVMINTADEILASAANTLRKYRSANFIAGEDHVSEPHLYVTYNRRPTLGAVTLTPAPQGGVLLSPTTVFSAPVTDPDNDQVRLRIEVTDLTTGEVKPTVQSGLVNSGQTASVALPLSLGLVASHVYRFVVRAADSTGGVSVNSVTHDLTYDAIPSVGALTGEGIDGNASVGVPRWYEADVSDLDPGQEIMSSSRCCMGRRRWVRRWSRW